MIGNMTVMPHLSTIGWDWADRMESADLGGGGTVYFVYDSAGQRVRKVWDKTSTLRDERIYLGGFEIFRSSTSGSVDTERETLHVMDDQRRVAMVETLTIDSGIAVTTPTPRQRYQVGNQLESVAVELTETGAIISYEEYFSFGMTSFRSAPTGSLYSAKRYRYTGKERDDETGLYYHGARYYAAWLGRWTAADPSLGDGLNAYSYVRNNPIKLNDPDGRAGQPAGLTVSGESKLSTDQLLAMIKRNPHLTDWMKNAFFTSGNRLLVKPNVQLPHGVSQGDIPKWFLSATTAINSGEWHLTTGAANVSREVLPPDKKLQGDLEPGDVPVGARPKEGGITTGETIDPPTGDQIDVRRHMADESAGSRTNASYRRPGQGLVVVATRFRSSADPKRETGRSEDAILDTLFHELAAHAGLHSEGKPDEHKHPWEDKKTEADEFADEVKRVFSPPDESNEIEALMPPATAAPTPTTPDILVTREVLMAAFPRAPTTPEMLILKELMPPPPMRAR